SCRSSRRGTRACATGSRASPPGRRSRGARASSRRDMHNRFDVAIVGYGPVGQTLAILLRQRGWRVGVVQKRPPPSPPPPPSPLPRAVHCDHEVARIFQAAGLGGDIPRLTEPADIYEWRNAAGETLLVISARGTSLSGWPEANMFAQPELERTLDARARTLP